MKLKSVAACNLAGSTFKHNLSPVTLFVGQNTAGKTTRLNACVLALSGQIPLVAKTGRDLYDELATGATMSVGVETDAGSVSRTYVLKRDSVKATVDVLGLPEDFALPPVAVDAGEFFRLSPRERVKFIFGRLSSGSDRLAVVDGVLSKVKSHKLPDEEHTPEAEAQLREYARDISQAFEDAWRDELDLEEAVDLVCAEVATTRGEADANAKRLAQTLQGITQVAQDSAPPAPDCENKLTEARAVLALAQAEVGRTKQEARTLEGNLAELRRRAVPPDEHALNAEIEELVRQRELAAKVQKPGPFDEAAVVPSPEDARTLEALSAKKRALFESAQLPEIDVAEDRQRLARARDNQTIAAQSDRDLNNEIVRLRRERDETAAEKCCSKCGQSIVKLKEQVVADLARRVQELEAKMASSSSVLAVAQENLRLAEEAVRLADETNGLRRQNAAEYRRVDDLHRTARENVVRKARRDHDQAVDSYTRAQGVVTARTEAIAALRLKLEDRSAADAQAEVPAVAAKLTVAISDALLASQNQTREELAVMGLEAEVRRLHARREEDRQRARIETELAGHALAAKVGKDVLRLLDDAKRELVDRAVGPFVQRMNEVCGPLLPHPLAYEAGSLGFRRGSKLVEKTMSGAERALAFAAVSVALAVESPAKLLIVDELGRLDVDRKQKFILHVLDLVGRGVLDGVLCADTSPVDYLDLVGGDNFGVVHV